MKVHLIRQDGKKETVGCESIWEVDNGLYLMAQPTTKLRDAIGYVPFERLDYVEPDNE